MDRKTVYRDELPYEADVLLAQRYAYEGLGLALADIIGTATVFGGFPCAPTSPASMSVKVGPGRVYTKTTLEASDWGKRAGTGGVDADTVTDHQIVKQGILRDTQTFALAAPTTSGQSICYLIEAAFSEVDDTAVTTLFYNSTNPAAPITDSVSPARLDKAVLQVKAGTAATTGSQTAPSVDAGWIPLWVVTIAYGATTIVSGNIAAHPSAPAISISGGGGGGGYTPTPWTTVTSTHTCVSGERLKAKSAGGAFTLTLPAAPADGDQIDVVVDENAATNNVTIARNGKKIAGASSDLIMQKNNRGVKLIYDSAGGNWMTWP